MPPVVLECIYMPPGRLPRRRTTSTRVIKHAQTVFSGGTWTRSMLRLKREAKTSSELRRYTVKILRK
jgi:hypothetical protein